MYWLFLCSRTSQQPVIFVHDEPSHGYPNDSHRPAVLSRLRKSLPPEFDHIVTAAASHQRQRAHVRIHTQRSGAAGGSHSHTAAVDPVIFVAVVIDNNAHDARDAVHRLE